MAQWIRHRPMEPGIAGSSPAGVIMDGVLAPMQRAQPFSPLADAGSLCDYQARRCPTRHRPRLNKG